MNMALERTANKNPGPFGPGLFVTEALRSDQSLPARCWIIMNVSNVYSESCIQR